MLRKRALLLAALSVGCTTTPGAVESPAAKGPPSSQASDAPKATPGEPSAALNAPAGEHDVLRIGELSLSNEKGENLTLAANGEVTKSPGAERVGSLLADGRFLDPEGKLAAHLSREGEVISSTGTRLPLKIDETGTITLDRGSQTLSFDTEGRLVGGNANAPETRIRGMTPELRKTAAFLLILAAFPLRH